MSHIIALKTNKGLSLILKANFLVLKYKLVCLKLYLAFGHLPLRRRVQMGLDKGEACNALARAVFFYRRGEIRDRSFEQQRYRVSMLLQRLSPLGRGHIILTATTCAEIVQSVLASSDRYDYCLNLSVRFFPFSDGP
jgi:hypothetical protein